MYCPVGQPSIANNLICLRVQLLNECCPRPILCAFPARPFVYLPLVHGHFETIFGALYRTCPQVIFRRTCLAMPDGGVVALDWPMRCEALGSGILEDPAPGAPWLILLVGSWQLGLYHNRWQRLIDAKAVTVDLHTNQCARPSTGEIRFCF